MTNSLRNTELSLLILVSVVIAGAYAPASLATDAELPPNLVPFLGIIFGLLMLAHVALRRLAPLAEPLLLPLAGLLNGLGYVFIARLDRDLAGLAFVPWKKSASPEMIRLVRPLGPPKHAQ